MNEIEKMYENAGLSNMWVERYDDKEIWHISYSEMINTMMKLNDWTRQVAIDVAKKECKKEFPPFTAKKQLSLIIFLSYKYNKGLLINLRAMEYDFELFGECLAKLVNELWQDLTEEERKQIKEILSE